MIVVSGAGQRIKVVYATLIPRSARFWLGEITPAAEPIVLPAGHGVECHPTHIWWNCVGC